MGDQNKKGSAARRGALSLLEEVVIQGRMLSEAPLPQGLSGPDRARAQRLAQETLRQMQRADHVLKPYLRTAPPETIHLLLRLAVVELAGGEAAHGVINDAVNMTKSLPKQHKLSGLVNGVLRNVTRRGLNDWDGLPVPKLPTWLRKRLVKTYGNETVQRIELAHLKATPLDLTPRRDAAEWAARLEARLLSTGSIRLDRNAQVSTLDGFAEGAWWVQDAAAAVPAMLVHAAQGAEVLDLCAAPGGKTLQLAARGFNVTAVDISERRLERLHENLARTGLTATIRIEDAIQHKGSYDAVLLDAPCSATGTIRRHPDLPYVKQATALKELTALQHDLLRHAATLVRPGGNLIYCTCSLLPEEGETQVAQFLKAHPEFTPDEGALEHTWIEDHWRAPDAALRLRPDFWTETGGMDGFYIAMLKRA